jgi:hypothetical protein
MNIQAKWDWGHLRRLLLIIDNLKDRNRLNRDIDIIGLDIAKIILPQKG